MAGVSNESTPGRVCSMWVEAGVQFRSNVLLHPGDAVPLHVHSYDHVMLVTRGIVSVQETAPTGEQRTFVMAGAHAAHPYRLTMPAGSHHRITCVEGPAEVLCLWGCAA